MLTSRVEVTSDLRVSSAQQKRRLAEVRRQLAEGSDPWAQRFAALAPAAEWAGWEKKLGELSSFSRAAVLTETEDLSRFFADTAVQVTYVVRPESGLAELTLVPGASNRATSRQRRDLDAILGDWSDELAAYFAAARAVYAYLDEHPERAHALLGNVFHDLLPEGEKPEELSAEEARRAERLEESMGRVIFVLQAEEGEAYSIDEISHLVYDPFPAKLEIDLPGPAREVEGFERTPAGRLTVRGCGFWDALGSLKGRWLEPDLVSVYAEELRNASDDVQFDFNGFLSQPRRATGAPDGPEVREALTRALSPSRTYRATWEIRPESDPPADLWKGFDAP